MESLEGKGREELVSIFVNLLKKKTALPRLLERPFRKRARELPFTTLVQKIRDLEVLEPIKREVS